MSHLLCALFGHPMSAPYFTDDGKWHCECTRGDLKLDGVIPAQHTHSYGPKFRRDSIWYWACPCGHVQEAPVPVKRAKKPAIDSGQGTDL